MKTDEVQQETPAFISKEVSNARRFFLDLNPASCPGIRVVCGGLEQCASNYALSRQGFPYSSIEFIAGGHGELKLQGRVYELTAGTVFSYGPEIPHEITTDSTNPLAKYFVDFVGEEALRLLTESSLALGSCVQVSGPAQVRAIFEELIREGSSPGPLTPRICALLLSYLILKIGEKSITHGAASTGAFLTYERCRNYIEANFLNVRTLEEVAQGCNVDKTYLCRLFKKFDHQSLSLIHI